MLDAKTYNLETGEWKQVADDYARLEAEALRQYISLAPEYRDAYKQLLLYPVQAMSNLYEMYYAQAMNHKLYAENNPEANRWADKVEQTFARDKALSQDYNQVMSGGKWKNMMIQKHIGYTSWNDNFPADKMPEVYRIAETGNTGGYVYAPSDGYVAMEAPHYYESRAAEGLEWVTVPDMGRTAGGVTLIAVYPAGSRFDPLLQDDSSPRGGRAGACRCYRGCEVDPCFPGQEGSYLCHRVPRRGKPCGQFQP